MLHFFLQALDSRDTMTRPCYDSGSQDSPRKGRFQRLRLACLVGTFSGVVLVILTFVRAAFVGFPAGTLVVAGLSGVGGFLSGFVTTLCHRLLGNYGRIGSILTGCLATMLYLASLAVAFGRTPSPIPFLITTCIYGIPIGWFLIPPYNNRR
jgi:hypothetical protein